MMFGLKTATIQAIQEVFKKHPEVEKAILYGSRAKGNYRPGSDIDLTLKGEKLSLTLLQKIENEIDELLLPYKMDLSLHKQVQNAELLEHIVRVGKVFYDRNEILPSKNHGQGSESMSEWKEFLLGDIAEVQTGPFGSQLHMSDYKLAGTPIITVEHLGDNKIIHSNLPLVGDDDKNRLIKYTLKEGDIVFSRVGSVDRRAYVSKDEDGWMFSGRCLRVRANNNLVNPRYLSFYFGQESFKETIRMVAVGATMPSINTAILSELEVKIPPLPEQTAIAEVLSSLDDKIDLLHRQNNTLEQLAETLFRQWFVHRPELVDGEEAEESWEVGSIDDVCERINSGGTPSTRIEAYYNGDINWYSTKELNDGFLFESISKITQEGLDNSSAKLFPENTVVIAIYAAPTVGRLGILANEAAFNQAACGFIADESKVCFEYLYLHLLKSRQQLNDMASGSAQQNLNVGIMKEFEILIPPTVSMNKFREQVRPIFQKIKSNTQQIRTLTQLRDTLLPKLMSGEIRLNLDLHDEQMNKMQGMLNNPANPKIK